MAVRYSLLTLLRLTYVWIEMLSIGQQLETDLPQYRNEAEITALNSGKQHFFSRFDEKNMRLKLHNSQKHS